MHTHRRRIVSALTRLTASRVGATVLILTALLTSSSAFMSAPAQSDGFPSQRSGDDDQKTPFDFEYFDELLGTVPEKERERLCGLDKVCIDLWRKGKLQIYKEGRLLEGDFNGDGVSEQAMILETDVQSESEAPADRKDFWIHITQATDESTAPDKLVKGRKVLLHEMLPNAFNVIDFSWDAKRKGLVIDVGERLTRSTGAGISDLNQALGTVHPGRTDKVVVVVTWNDKTNKYDLLVPIKGLKHRRRNA